MVSLCGTERTLFLDGGARMGMGLVVALEAPNQIHSRLLLQYMYEETNRPAVLEGDPP